MSYTANIIPTMTSPTAPSGVASASSEFSATYPAWKAFNHANAVQADGWWAAAPPASVQYQFPAAHTITGYAVTSSFNLAAYAPESWTFKGSNDGAAWTTLDTQTNITTWSDPQTCKVYDLANATAYAYYRLDITASPNNSFIGVGELEMMMEAAYVPVGAQFAGTSGPIVKIGAQDWTLDPGPFRVTGVQLSGSMPGGHGSASFDVPVANAYLAPHHSLREGAWVVIYDDAHELYEGEIFSVKPSVDSSGQHKLSVVCGGFISVAGKRADVSATWVHRGSEGWRIRPGITQQSGSYSFDSGYVELRANAGDTTDFSIANCMQAAFVLDDGLSDDELSYIAWVLLWDVTDEGGSAWAWYLYALETLGGSATLLTSQTNTSNPGASGALGLPAGTKIIVLQLACGAASHVIATDRFVCFKTLELFGQGRTTRPRIDEAMVQLATRPGLAVTSYSEPVGGPMDDLRVGNGAGKVSAAGGLDYLAKLYAQPFEWGFGDNKLFSVRPMPIAPDNDSKVIVVGGGNPGLESWEVAEYDEDVPDYVCVLFGNKDDLSLPEAWPRRLYRPSAPADDADLFVITLDYSDRILSDASAVGIGDNRLGKGLSPTLPYGAVFDMDIAWMKSSGWAAPATTSGWGGGGTAADPYCLLFNGTDDYVSYGDRAPLNLGTGARTVAAWVNLDAGFSSTGVIFSKRLAGSSGYRLEVLNSRQISAVIADGATDYRQAYGGTALTTGLWYHVAAVYAGSGGNWAVYINGIADSLTHAGTAGAWNSDSASAMVWGEVDGLGSPASPLYGNIACATVWGRALTPAEIFTAYQSGPSTYTRSVANGTVVLSGPCKNRKGAPVPAHHVRSGWWIQNTETGSGQPLYVTGHSVDLEGKKNALTIGKDWMEEEIGVRMGELLAIPATQTELKNVTMPMPEPEPEPEEPEPDPGFDENGRWIPWIDPDTGEVWMRPPPWWRPGMTFEGQTE